MSYLTPGDYKKSIQADNLTQIIHGDASTLEDAEATAIEEAKSRLIQKYQVDREFTDTVEWDVTDTYRSGDRVYLNPAAYVSANTYNVGAYVTYTTGAPPISKVYKCNTNATTGAFDPAKWDEVGAQYCLFYAKSPYPEFNYQTMYKAGTQVIWKDNVYTCKIGSTQISHEQAIQYLTYNNIPYGNVFPDDSANGLQYWGAPTSYLLSPGVDILDDTKWVKGDNRSKSVVWCVVAIALYYVHDRISPRNIPDLRVKNYDDALSKLKDFAVGKDRTAINLIPIQPKTGGRVRFGGNVKNNNTY